MVAKLGWYISAREGPSVIAKTLFDKNVSDADVIYTPER